MKTDNFKALGTPNSSYVGPLEEKVLEKMAQIRSGLPPALAAINPKALECIPWEVYN